MLPFAVRRPSAFVATTVVALVAVALGAAVAPGPAVAAQAKTSSHRYRDPVFSRVTVHKNVRYGQAPGVAGATVQLRLDVYAPKGDAVKKRPAVIWLHGGGFVDGDKTDPRTVAMAKLFARRGYVALSANYRLLGAGCDTSKGVTPQCYAAAMAGANDAQAAVRFLRRSAKKYRIDTRRIAIGGESAGAIAATGVAALSAQPGTSGNPGYSSAVRAFVSLSGGLPGGLFVDAHTAPGILFSGTADDTVPYDWSVQTRDAMKKNHVRTVLKTFPGGGHIQYLWPDHHASIEADSSAFVYSALDAAHAQGARR